MSAYRSYQATGRIDLIPSLKDFYAEDFRIGAAVSPHWMFRPECDGALRKHFSSITAENVMKPEVLLDHAATLASGSETRAVFNFSPAAPIMDYAQRNSIAVRFHVLVWHNQTPRWFFTKGWSQEPDAPYADRETMIQRLENSIADEMAYVNATWPGLVYAWDVVNEAIEPDHQAPNLFRTKSHWYQVLGEDFVPLAFRFARKHQADGQKLYYNDFNMAMPNKTPAVYQLVKKLHAGQLIDGVGFQTHIGMDYPDFAYYEQTVRAYAALGLTIQATEMDIRIPGADPASQMKLAVRYRDYFAMMRRLRREGVDIDSITLWGLADDHSWLMGWNGPTYPLLFDGMLRPKAAFFGALLDEAIPAAIADVQEADILPLEKPYKPLAEQDPSLRRELGTATTLDPYQAIRPESAAILAGAAIAPGRNGTVLYTQVAQSWSMLSRTDFGSKGASALEVSYNSVCDASVSIVLDDLHAAPAAVLALPKAFNGQTLTLDLPASITGTHDLFLVFSAPALRFRAFRFL